MEVIGEVVPEQPEMTSKEVFILPSYSSANEKPEIGHPFKSFPSNVGAGGS